MRTIVIFGAGLGGRRAAENLTVSDRVIAFVDNDVSKQRQGFCGRPVLPPYELKRLEYDIVLVASCYATEIVRQLMDIGVPLDQVEVVEETILDHTRPEFLSVPYWSRWLIGLFFAGAVAVFIFALYGVYRLVGG